MMRCGDEIKLTVTKPNPMKLAPLPLMARQSIHVWFPTMYHTYFDICTGYTLRVRISHFIFAAPWPRNQFTSEHMLHLHLISYHGDHCIFAVSPTHCKHNNISKRMQIKPCVSISVMLLILYLWMPRKYFYVTANRWTGRKSSGKTLPLPCQQHLYPEIPSWKMY